MTKGKLYLIPNKLGENSLEMILPMGVMSFVGQLRIFAVENVKFARRLLRQMDASFPIDASIFVELNKRSNEQDINILVKYLLEGKDVGIISDAGCPGIADPGSQLVAAAHKNNLFVVPFVGPSSILLSLMASGFSGQKFSFHGYIPKERKRRIDMIRIMEQSVLKTGATQVFIETPFRNSNLLDDLFGTLNETTFLCVASSISTPQERIRTKSIAEWKRKNFSIDKVPAIFLLGLPQ